MTTARDATTRFREDLSGASGRQQQAYGWATVVSSVVMLTVTAIVAAIGETTAAVVMAMILLVAWAAIFAALAYSVRSRPYVGKETPTGVGGSREAEAHAQKPWWRDWRQLPPGSRSPASMMAPSEVWIVRAGLVLFVAAAVAVVAFERALSAAALLLIVPVAALARMPRHQRRQLLGLGPDQQG